MSGGMCHGEERIELYFYGELAPAERADTAAHLEDCDVCRQTLADLEEIDHVLGDRRVDAPPAGDWGPFMARLDARVGPARSRAYRSWMQMAAALVLVAGGAFGGWTWSRMSRPADTGERASSLTPADAAIADRGGSELERARLVLAGLAAKTDGDTWSLERDMAARLLPEVTLIRQAASQRGRTDLEDILMDVETLLLQASYAETADADTLARLRKMIERRDVLMRLSLAGRPEV
jgi:hypothetical protein